jgi:hypothetical protein
MIFQLMTILLSHQTRKINMEIPLAQESFTRSTEYQLRATRDAETI